MSEKQPNDFKLFWIIGFGAVALWIGNFFAAPYILSAVKIDNITDVAQMGDMFGGLTSLFTGLAFAGLISTLVMQRRDLELQRKAIKLQTTELEKMVAEMAAQQKQMELQNAHIQQQMFEATFFQMLDVFNSHVASMEERLRSSYNPVSGKEFTPEPITGRRVFEHYLTNLETSASKQEIADTFGATIAYQYDKSTQKLPPLKQYPLMASYRSKYSGTKNDGLSTYFRLLHNLIELIDLTEFDKDEPNNHRRKKRYTNIVRALLSRNEIWIIILNKLTSNPEEFHDFKSRLDRFDMFKHCGELEGFGIESFEHAAEYFLD